MPSHTILHTTAPHPLHSNYLFESTSGTHTHTYTHTHAHARTHTHTHTHSSSISTKKHFKIAQLIFMPLILAKSARYEMKALFECFPGFYGFYKKCCSPSLMDNFIHYVSVSYNHPESRTLPSLIFLSLFEPRTAVVAQR